MDKSDFQNNILQFKTANFLPSPRLFFTKAATIDRLQNSAAEALFYFFSNQYEKISDDHINNVNALFVASRKNVGAFLAPATVLDSIEAIRSEKLPVNKACLAQLIADCRDEHFAINLVEAAVANNLNLVSPFSENRAVCQESYEVKNGKRALSGMNCLRFTDGNQCFFLMQFASSADGIYFPKENILISLAHVNQTHISFLQTKLISDFFKVIAYVKSTKTFVGIIASYSDSLGHFYYENWPVLVEIHNKPNLYEKIPNIIMRKGYDFNDLDLMFEHGNHLLLDSNEIDNVALNENKWFVLAGTDRRLRRNTFCYDVADQYLVDKIIQSPFDITVEKANQVKDCYPLVWIGVEGQKRCWLEQVEGYAYIFNGLAKRYPHLGVIIDGWTVPFTPSKQALNEAKKDRQLAKKIVRQLTPKIPYIFLMGENSHTKIFVGSKIDFFICNFATGSMHVSRLLGKPGFCHLSGELSTTSLRFGMQIHPNKNVYLLPKKYVTDRHDIAFSYFETFKKFVFNAINRLILRNQRSQKKAANLGRLSYSIDKNEFCQFIEQRLDKVLINTQTTKLRFFLEPSFSIHPDVRHYLKMAAYGNVLDVFPTLTFPKYLADLTGFTESYLKQHIIYGVFAFGGHELLKLPSEYMVWLGDPLERVQLHALQFAINAANENRLTDMTAILKMGHKDLDNYYTRLISGLDAPFGECTETMLDTAIGNLTEHFVFIGINGQQSQSFDRLCTLMDWDRSLFPDGLPNKFTIKPDDFSENDRLLANGLIEYDLRLYEAALAMVNGVIL